MYSNSNKNSTKNAPKFFVSTFNAQSISNDSYLLEFENALKEVKYDVIGLSEVKRIGEGQIQLKDFTLFYYGKERRRGTVGFAIKSKWLTNIVSCKNFSDRIISLKMKFTTGTLGIIQSYAPTSSSSENEIKDFYDLLSKATDEMSNETWLIILGDFNAKIGVPDVSENDVAGQFGIGERNDRGNMLMNFSFRTPNLKSAQVEDGLGIWEEHGMKLTTFSRGNHRKTSLLTLALSIISSSILIIEC